MSEWRCVRIVLCLNGVVSEWRSVGMALRRNAVVSERRCVLMALCWVSFCQVMFFTVTSSLTIARTDTVFFFISEVSEGMVSLVEIPSQF